MSFSLKRRVDLFLFSCVLVAFSAPAFATIPGPNDPNTGRWDSFSEDVPDWAIAVVPQAEGQNSQELVQKVDVPLYGRRVFRSEEALVDVELDKSLFGRIPLVGAITRNHHLTVRYMPLEIQDGKSCRREAQMAKLRIPLSRGVKGKILPGEYPVFEDDGSGLEREVGVFSACSNSVCSINVTGSHQLLLDEGVSATVERSVTGNRATTTISVDEDEFTSSNLFLGFHSRITEKIPAKWLVLGVKVAILGTLASPIPGVSLAANGIKLGVEELLESAKIHKVLKEHPQCR